MEADRVFGYARKELLGQSIKMLVSERFPASYTELSTRVRRVLDRVARPSLRRVVA